MRSDRAVGGTVKVLALVVFIVGLALARPQLQTSVTVKELPPEAIPAGTCKEDQTGYLGITKNGKEETRLTDQEIGEYVRVRLSQGYSVSLYPQVSGRIFAISQCESIKH